MKNRYLLLPIAVVFIAACGTGATSAGEKESLSDSSELIGPIPDTANNSIITNNAVMTKKELEQSVANAIAEINTQIGELDKVNVATLSAAERNQLGVARMELTRAQSQLLRQLALIQVDELKEHNKQLEKVIAGIDADANKLRQHKKRLEGISKLLSVIAKAIPIVGK